MTGHSLLRWQSPTTTRGSRSPGTLQKGTKRIWCCCLTWWLLLLIIYMMTKYAAENMDLYCCSLDERLFIIHSAPLPWKLPMISNWQMPLLTNVIIDKCHYWQMSLLTNAIIPASEQVVTPFDGYATSDGSTNFDWNGRFFYTRPSLLLKKAAISIEIRSKPKLR